VAEIPPADLIRVDWLDPRAVRLREAMDVEMTELYASVGADASDEDNAMVQRALHVDDSTILISILALVDGEAVGHTALRPYGDELEVKKVFVTPEFRGRGISKQLMREAEVIAGERGVASLVLQTGDRQHEAIALYLRIGYIEIPVFPPYDVIPVAICYRKTL
jgi:GNAT superfamily N-acetyltransferase